MKRLLRMAATYLLLLCLPFGGFLAVAECLPNRRANSFTVALADKYDRLCTLEGQKAVLIGGSSLPFGLRSDLMEKELGLSVVDFGVYAALGTKVMLELSLANIGRGDIVVLAPEIDLQTYSDYFDGGILWEAACEEREILRYLSAREKWQMFYHLFPFSLDRIRLAGGEDVPDGTLYARSSFNTWGDLAYPRPYNVMVGGWDTSQPITLDGLANAAFADMINAYIDEVHARGADIYFTFSPQNAAAVAYTAEEATEFEAWLRSHLHCTILGGLSDTTYETGYFYNTNYHLNDAGAVLHTVHMINLMKTALHLETPTEIEILPVPVNPEETLPEDANAQFFDVTEIGGALYLSGVKEAYRGAVSLTLPTAVDGRRVVGVCGNAFVGCTDLAELTIPDTYRAFDSGIFCGCGNLRAIYLAVKDPGATSVPVAGMFDGAAPDLRVYIPASEYASFTSNYTWRVYRSYFEKYEPAPKGNGL